MYSAKYGGRSGRSKGKQATSKKKKHQKCSLCQEKGHDAEDCPRAKNPTKNSGGAGSGRSHKTSRRAGAKEDGKTDADGGSEGSCGLLPPGFYANVDDLVADVVVAADEAPPPPVLFDAGCDVGEALDVIASANKKKSATVTYRNAAAAIPYAGCLCRQLLKPGKPWKAASERTSRMKEADPNTLFVLGLGNGFLVDDEDEDEEEAAISALLSAFDVDESVVGVFAKLDYSILDRPGCDREAQLRRFRATCIAATDADVPIQCRVAPGPSEAASILEGGDEEADEENVDPYILVMRDLATVLLEMSPEDAPSTLKIHLSCWNGNSTHMMKLLGAFPDNLFIGMNAAVGFAKATRAHECAFDVPLNRLLLETDAPHAIPAPVTIAMGRAAFCHSGLVPFVAAAVAEHKGNLGVSAIDVARAAMNNVVHLYGQAVADCVEDASADLEELIHTARKEKEEAELEEAAKEEDLEGNVEEVIESKQDRKKKKKKKGKGGAAAQGAGEEGSAELDFDEGFLAAMVDDNQ